MGIFAYRAHRANYANSTDAIPTYSQYIVLLAIDRVIDAHEALS